MAIHLKIIGILLILLASVHVIFPKYFNWKQELKLLSLINRQIMSVHMFFIALIVLMMGALCLVATNELTETKLGKTIALGLCIFWSVRLFVQLFVYSTSLWKGKMFETTVHIFFSLLWTYICIVFFLIAIN